MTVGELYSHVAQLGFETELEDDDRFYFASNRAILQVNKLRPAIGCCYINHKPLKNLLNDNTFTPIEKDDDLYFYTNGAKSYYFEVEGIGVVYFEKYDEELNEWKAFNTVSLIEKYRFETYKGFIKDGSYFLDKTVRIRLHFTGEFIYYVKNIALYDKLLSDNEEDIPPFMPYIGYKISELATDFISFCSPPVMDAESDNIVCGGYSIEGSETILFPYNSKGLYKILYNRKPKEITSEDTENAVIDLDSELCALLPLLVAVYIWIDDEPQKAEYYKRLYDEQAVELERKGREGKPVIIKTNGW